MIYFGVPKHVTVVLGKQKSITVVGNHRRWKKVEKGGATKVSFGSASWF